MQHRRALGITASVVVLTGLLAAGLPHLPSQAPPASGAGAAAPALAAEVETALLPAEPTSAAEPEPVVDVHGIRSLDGRDRAAHDHASHDHGTGEQALPQPLVPAKPGDPDHLDPAPKGVDVTRPVSTQELQARAGIDAAGAREVLTEVRLGEAAYVPPGTPASGLLTEHVAPSCSGTGADGNRVQAVYAFETGRTDRYRDVLPVLLHEIGNVDDTFALSARKTGGGRQVRWVTGAGCVPDVLRVELPVGSFADFSATVRAMQAAGHTRRDRKYVVFADANVLCGVANLYYDSDRTSNANDGAYAQYGRTDAGCWSQHPGQNSVVAHELMHNLGAVQPTAPHRTTYGHCWDGDDVMCYSDGSPEAQQRVCPATHEVLFDCGDDDYFSVTPPAGSYLATSWNTADSTFLTPTQALAPGPTATAVVEPAAPVTGIAFTTRASTTPGVTIDGWRIVQRPAAGYCWRGFRETTTDPVASWTCSATSAGSTVTFAATATRASDGLKSLVTLDVTLRRNPGPALQVYVTPDEPVGGTWFNVGAQASDGVTPYTYSWTHDASDCESRHFGGPHDVSLLCPADDRSRVLTGTVTVRQADGGASTLPYRAVVAARYPAPPSPMPTVSPTTTTSPVPTTSPSPTTTPTPTAGPTTPAPTASPTPTRTPAPPVSPSPTLAPVTVRASGPASLVAGTVGTFAATASRPGTVLTWRTSRTDCKVVSISGTSAKVQCAAAARGSLVVSVVADDPASRTSATARATTNVVAPPRAATRWSISGRAGRPDVLSAQLIRGSTGLSGQVARLQQRVGSGPWAWSAPSTRTGTRGLLTVTLQPRTTVSYRWYFPGTATLAPSTSAAVTFRY